MIADTIGDIELVKNNAGRSLSWGVIMVIVQLRRYKLKFNNPRQIHTRISHLHVPS